MAKKKYLYLEVEGKNPEPTYTYAQLEETWRLFNEGWSLNVSMAKAGINLKLLNAKKQIQHPLMLKMREMQKLRSKNALYSRKTFT